MATVYLGLGTNLGNKHENLKKALDLLAKHSKISIIKQSSILETDPVDFREQPKFLNQILIIDTELTPLSLLYFIKECENKMGREYTISKGPRIIDIDILLYEKLKIQSEKLTIPHPEIKKRPFIVHHLLELTPGLIDPDSNQKYSEVSH